MGAKDWMLAYCETDPRAVLRVRPALDHAAARAAVERLQPGRILTAIEDGNLGENSNPDDDLIYVGAFSGLTLVCTSIAALDKPAQLPRSVIEAIPASTLYLHAMHSAVDWFAYAVWTDGQLRRSLSLSPDSGIMENVGAPWRSKSPIGPAGTRPSTLRTRIRRMSLIRCPSTHLNSRRQPFRNYWASSLKVCRAQTTPTPSTSPWPDSRSPDVTQPYESG